MNNETSLRVNSIKRQIAEQEKKISEFHLSIKEFEKQIAEKKADQETSELIISSLKTSLEKHGIEYNSNEFSNDVVLSKDFTLKIVKEANNPSGIQAKNIVIAYADLGIKTHNRTIDEHLAELVDDGVIYQTNPDNKRGRLYKAK